MNPITREYLDALAARHDGTPREAVLVAALRRVLDALDALEESGDYNPYPDLRAALAGTQTDDGAGRTAVTGGAANNDQGAGTDAPAPSSPRR